MKTDVFFFFILFGLLPSFFGCANVQPANEKANNETENFKQEYIGPITEYFVTTMTLFDEAQQPNIGMVEINEKDAFIELVRQILHDPDYEYSYIQNDQYYVAQIYNTFSVAEFTSRSSDKYEIINSTETQATYKNVITGTLMEIRTQLNKGRYGEFRNFFLNAGYFVATETFDYSQLILLKDYHDISNLVTDVEISDFISYFTDKDAFWGIAEDIIGVDLDDFNNEAEFSSFLKSLLFEEDKQIGRELEKRYGKQLKEGDIVRLSYIYKGNKKGFDFVYKPYHDVFIDDLLTSYDYARAIERPSTWKYLEPQATQTLFKEDIYIEGFGILNYSLSNNPSDIENEVLSRFNIKINLSGVNWNLNGNLAKNVKDAINKYNVNYSMAAAISPSDRRRYFIVNRRLNNEWFYAMWYY
jgi:hypothetical protein